ncbi:MAG TPA: hypothetical protein VGL23_00130 [Chloroflexota bacterium]
MGVWIWLFGAIVLLILWEVEPDLAIRLILAGLAALGGWLAIRSALRLRAARRQPVLALSSDQLLVGQPFRLRYGRGAAGAAGVRTVTARLICRESTTDRSTGQRQSATDAHDWVAQAVEAELARGGGSAELELAIPLDAMHSFRSRHYQIGWRVEVETGPARGGSGGRVDLPLIVLPAIYEPDE